MTSTENRRTVRRTTALVRSGGKSKNVIISLQGDQIEMRLAGERKRFRLSASVAYAIAVNAWVQSEKLRKRAVRTAKRKK